MTPEERNKAKSIRDHPSSKRKTVAFYPEFKAFLPDPMPKSKINTEGAKLWEI